MARRTGRQAVTLTIWIWFRLALPVVRFGGWALSGPGRFRCCSPPKEGRALPLELPAQRKRVPTCPDTRMNRGLSLRRSGLSAGGADSAHDLRRTRSQGLLLLWCETPPHLKSGESQPERPDAFPKEHRLSISRSTRAETTPAARDLAGYADRPRSPASARATKRDPGLGGRGVSLCRGGRDGPLPGKQPSLARPRLDSQMNVRRALTIR